MHHKVCLWCIWLGKNFRCQIIYFVCLVKSRNSWFVYYYYSCNSTIVFINIVHHIFSLVWRRDSFTFNQEWYAILKLRRLIFSDFRLSFLMYVLLHLCSAPLYNIRMPALQVKMSICLPSCFLSCRKLLALMRAFIWTLSTNKNSKRW